MTNDWILDVLMDLKTFAARNDMRMLASELDVAAAVAKVELRSAAQVETGEKIRHAGHAGTLHRTTPANKIAS